MLLQTPEKPATKTVHVEVTAEDIAERGCRDTSNCMLALAIRRVLGFPVDVVGVTDEPGRGPTEAHAYVPFRRFVLPREAHKAALRFDAGLSVEPFSFDLELPE